MSVCRVVLQRRFTGKFLDRLQGNGYRFFTRFRPAEIVFDFDEEVIDRRIGQQLLASLVFRIGAVSAHRYANSTRTSLNPNQFWKLLFSTLQMFAQRDSRKCNKLSLLCNSTECLNASGNSISA